MSGTKVTPIEGALELYRRLPSGPDKRLVEIGEGTHLLMLEKEPDAAVRGSPAFPTTREAGRTEQSVGLNRGASFQRKAELVLGTDVAYARGRVAPGYQTSPCWLRLGRTMVKVLLFLGGLAILLVSSRQVFLMFRDGSFRARGNRLIVRNAHPIIFWMNFVGLVLFGVVGVALICWQLLT